MSRLGKKSVLIPEGVTAAVSGSKVTVKGPKGELNFVARPEISVEVSGSEIITKIVKETKESNAFWGTTRALIANMVKGVTDGFEKKMELVGVGYRAKPSADGISLTVGFSHPVEFPAPAGIKFDVPDQTTVIISGIDKQMVGLTAARLRKVRKPEPYKGKGIKYSTEVVRRKAGKSGKV